MDNKEIPIYILDAFTVGNNELFTGNTAAICLLDYDDEITDDLKQKISTEMNLPITVFVSRRGWSSKGSPTKDFWAIRWFTVTNEIRLCGHGTLAAAKIMFDQLKNDNILDELKEESTITMESKLSGSLGATIDWSTGQITLDFPLNTTTPLSRNEILIQDLIASTLGNEVEPDEIVDVTISRPLNFMTFCLRRSKNDGKDEDLDVKIRMLKNIKPDWTKMLSLDTGSLNAVLVTIKGDSSDGGPHYLVRAFAPWNGVNEDPVTGSAQTVVGPYWNKEFEKDGVKLDKLKALQLSERGGQVIVQVEGDRVKLSGNARLVLVGNFIV